MTVPANWRYLMREIDSLYRHQSAGGSKPIRAHQRAVRERISANMERSPDFHAPAASTKPVVDHLIRALDNGRRERTTSVVRAIAAIRDELDWQYGYEKVPKGLAGKYAFTEFAGPRGPVVMPDLIIGAVLFAPRCTYPAHSHDDIAESYVCLSGWVSENDDGVYAPGSMIYNPPDHRHRITTADFEPSLLIYAWLGPAASLSAMKMTFTREKTKKA